MSSVSSVQARPAAPAESAKRKRAPGGGRHPGTKLPRLRAWREWRLLSQGELGSLIGKTASYISAVETSRKGASLTMVRALAEALQIDVEQLLKKHPSGSPKPLAVTR